MTTLVQNNIDSIGYQLTEKLDELGSRLEVVDTSIGPQTIRFSMVAADGVRIGTISRLKDELAYEIGCPVAILAPVPGEKVVGIEIPNPLMIPKKI